MLIQITKIMTRNNTFNDIFCTQISTLHFFYFDRFVRACAAHTPNKFEYITIKMWWNFTLLWMIGRDFCEWSVKKLVRKYLEDSPNSNDIRHFHIWTESMKNVKITILCIVFWVEIRQERKKNCYSIDCTVFNIIKVEALLIWTIIQFRYLTNLNGVWSSWNISMIWNYIKWHRAFGCAHDEQIFVWWTNFRSYKCTRKIN